MNVGLGHGALAAEGLGAVGGGAGLAEPVGRGGAGLTGVVLQQTEVADGLGDGLLGLGDVVREVPDQLVQPLLGDKSALTDADWASLSAKFEAFDAWNAEKPANAPVGRESGLG